MNKKINSKNLLKQTTDKINKSKLRKYENLFGLVFKSRIICMDDNEANYFLNNLDGYTINVLNEGGDVLKIDINKKNCKQLVKILKYGMNENVDATVKIRKKSVGKNKINEYDNLIQQNKKDLVIKKEQTDKLNKKYNELKNYFNSEKQKLKVKNKNDFKGRIIHGFGTNDFIKFNINNKMNINENYNKFSKQDLINITLDKNKLINTLQTKINATNQKSTRPIQIPTPRRSVKQIIQDYEDNIIEPPLEFCDDYNPIPAKRTKTFDVNPIPALRTIIIKETNKALKGFTTSYEISIKNNKDPLIQLQITRKAVETHIDNVLALIKGLKFIETLKVKF